MLHPSLIEVDGTSLTDQGRSGVQVDRDERSVEVELANGTIKKYIKSVKKTFSMTWTWLPGSDSQTIDGGAGRDAMKSLFANSGDVHTLTFHEDNSVVTTFNVFVDSYNETTLRRSSDGYFWEVSVTFKEQ